MHLTQRALTSLSAELTRREKILAAAGAKDIEDYTERAGSQPRYPPLPRLVIVIDEFASLARDLPSFVAGLVGIAQRGPAQPSPWLAPLPRTLLLRDLPGLGRPPEPGQVPVPFGLIDLPSRQRQQPASPTPTSATPSAPAAPCSTPATAPSSPSRSRHDDRRP